MSNNENPPGDVSFSGLGLSPKLLAVLHQLKFAVPTPIQRQAIPVAVAGKDVIGIAQTGTGKTLAFALPLLQQIARTKKTGLIILPTRELAMQVHESLNQLGHSFGLRSALLIGGASMHNQLREVRRNPHVIIGTPGRIIDHLDQGSVTLRETGVLVLDEADRMLDMGFAPQINRILQSVPRERQTMLFSATMPPEIVKIAAAYMRTPVRVAVAQAGTVAERVDQAAFIVRKEHKSRLLEKLLVDHTGTVLVFSRTKYGAKKICRLLRDTGHSAAEIHSNLSLSQRKRSLEGFKSGTYRVLVATDIAARGIDVTNIALVINYDMPESADDYVHRVGRTGRAGKAGLAISFILPDQRDKIRGIERLVREQLKISPLPELPPDRMQNRQGYQSREQRISPTHQRTTFQYARPPRGDRRHEGRQRPAQRRAQAGRRHARVHL